MDSPNETSYAELSKDRVCSGCCFCLCLCRSGEGGPWLQLRAGREGAVRDGCGLCHGTRASPHAQRLLLWIPRPLPPHEQYQRKGAAGIHPGRLISMVSAWIALSFRPSLNQVSRVLFTDLSWPSASQVLLSAEQILSCKYRWKVWA